MRNPTLFVIISAALFLGCSKQAIKQYIPGQLICQNLSDPTAKAIIDLSSATESTLTKERPGIYFKFTCTFVESTEMGDLYSFRIIDEPGGEEKISDIVFSGTEIEAYSGKHYQLIIEKKL